MTTLVYTLHVFLCLFLIGIIMLQAGKGADISAVFGGASQTVFGARGPATFLNKLTIWVAGLFLATSLSLAIMAKKAAQTGAIDVRKVGTEEKAPAQDQPSPENVETKQH